MNVQLKINGIDKNLSVDIGETLLNVLRREGYYSVKHGCETGECGACSVLYKPAPSESQPAPTARIVNSCILLASQADGAEIVTVESLGNRNQLSVLQQAFIENGAIQCG
ncbi:MAG TPA: 2Fe-2S iron-sulfur cluster-binding protein, partial [Anaerolineae bacterium]